MAHGSGPRRPPRSFADRIERLKARLIQLEAAQAKVEAEERARNDLEAQLDHLVDAAMKSHEARRSMPGHRANAWDELPQHLKRASLRRAFRARLEKAQNPLIFERYARALFQILMGEAFGGSDSPHDCGLSWLRQRTPRFIKDCKYLCLLLRSRRSL